jgi:hypothetical protein
LSGTPSFSHGRSVPNLGRIAKPCQDEGATFSEQPR